MLTATRCAVFAAIMIVVIVVVVVAVTVAVTVAVIVAVVDGHGVRFCVVCHRFGVLVSAVCPFDLRRSAVIYCNGFFFFEN